MNERDIPRCTKLCCRTKQVFVPGQTYYSALIETPEGITRLDFSPEAWKEENKKVSDSKEQIIGWWRAVLPEADDKKVRLAPNDILFELFDQWLGDEERGDYLYILTLLMVRRRLLRLERSEEQTNEITVYVPRRELTYTIPVRAIPDNRIVELQETLAEIFYPKVS